MAPIVFMILIDLFKEKSAENQSIDIFPMQLRCHIWTSLCSCLSYAEGFCPVVLPEMDRQDDRGTYSEE